MLTLIRLAVLGLLRSTFGMFVSSGDVFLRATSTLFLRGTKTQFLDSAGSFLAEITANSTLTIGGTTFYMGGSSDAGGATTYKKMLFKKTGVADNTATAILTVTVPNGNHAASIRLWLMSSNGGADAFESTRVAQGLVVLARTTGANVVASAVALADAGIATVALGATHTLAYAVSAVSGAVGATNTFTVTVTIDDSGNLGSNQVLVLAEVMNAEISGVTVAAA
jgi:hypothetical protein